MELEVEFRCLLAKLGTCLSHSDSLALAYVYEISGLPCTGLHVLFSLEYMGFINADRPEWLKEVLNTTGRRDLFHYVQEYQKSAAYRKSSTREDYSTVRRLTTSGQEERRQRILYSLQKGTH